MTLYEELLQSDICEDPYLDAHLKHYFPTPLRERYESFMSRHPLRREILATYFTNTVINSTGLTMLQRFQEQFSFGAPEVTQAYLAAREIFDAAGYRGKIDNLDNQIPAALQIKMTIEVGKLVERAALWLLQNQKRPLNISGLVERYRGGTETVVQNVMNVITEEHRSSIEESIAQYVEAGVESGLATRCSSMRAMYSALDIVDVASGCSIPVQDAARNILRNWTRIAAVLAARTGFESGGRLLASTRGGKHPY